MPTALPMTSGQKEAVRQGTKEDRAIIEYGKLASEYERLKKENEGLRQELARKRQ